VLPLSSQVECAAQAPLQPQCEPVNPPSQVQIAVPVSVAQVPWPKHVIPSQDGVAQALPDQPEPQLHVAVPPPVPQLP
jgi:hypothetical protein